VNPLNVTFTIEMGDVANKSQERIIFFDGVCNLCNSFVDLTIRKDYKSAFHYASLQSDFAKQFLNEHGINPDDLDSIVLFENGEVYQKSTAALKITRKLSGLYPLMGVFWIVPLLLRNAVYDFIARNRYKWFGKKDACRVPTDKERELFLE
jgi:predicted DCC family thiol-disulfide oxidoreductase YuxK